MLRSIRREYMFMYFDMYPKGVTDTFGIHVRYIRIHQDTCILGASLVSRWLARWIHIGIYIKIHVSWTLHQDTTRYTEIQNQDTCGIHTGYILKYIPFECIQRGTYLSDTRYMRVTCICKGDQPIKIHARYMGRELIINVIYQGYMMKISNASRERCILYEGDMRDTCGIHAWIHVSSEAIKIHAGYIRNTCKIHAGYMWYTYHSGVWGNASMHHREQRTYQATHVRAPAQEAEEGRCSGSCSEGA